jgi:cation diffusion facilitator CzcD-associated flavoprotein CzcO
MAGILAAIRLREVGCDDLVVYEKAGRLGGERRQLLLPVGDNYSCRLAPS